MWTTAEQNIESAAEPIYS